MCVYFKYSDSINKKSKDFKAATDFSEYESSKWSLNTFRKWLSEKESPEVDI